MVCRLPDLSLLGTKQVQHRLFSRLCECSLEKQWRLKLSLTTSESWDRVADAFYRRTALARASLSLSFSSTVSRLTEWAAGCYAASIETACLPETVWAEQKRVQSRSAPIIKGSSRRNQQRFVGVRVRGVWILIVPSWLQVHLKLSIDHQPILELSLWTTTPAGLITVELSCFLPAVD